MCRQDSVYAVCPSGHPVHPDLPVGRRAAPPQPNLRPPLHPDCAASGHGHLSGAACTLVIFLFSETPIYFFFSLDIFVAIG